MSGLLKNIFHKIYAIIRMPNNTNLPVIISKMWYGSHNNHCSDATITESEMVKILNSKFPTAKDIKVEDTSGGCGAMFNIYVETDEFKGLAIIKQHRLIYDALKEQIKSIHGLHLVTKAPS